jgi:predicted O-methyltransferase YrrM
MQASASAERISQAPWRAVDTALADRRPLDLSWIQPPPTDDGWSLAPDALRFCARLIQTLQPQHVLEFGSGVSTELLLHAASDVPVRPCVTSIDHDPEFAAGSGGNLQCAPLVAREFGGKYLPAYLVHRDRILARGPVDLILVDGPPACLGGREGTLYQAMEYARPGTLLLLDDASRANERAVLSNWSDNLGDAIEVRQLPGFVKGLAAVTILEVVPHAELWSRREYLTKAELNERVPRGSGIVLAGHEALAGLLPECRKIPFWPPCDSDHAIQQFESMIASGAEYLAVLWPSFWWFDCYATFFEYLDSRSESIVRNDRMVLVRLGHQ